MQGRCESVKLNMFIYNFCVVRLLTEVCGIWLMDGSILPMHCPLLNVKVINLL